MRPIKLGIVLQARMGSTRLPGKVLRPMAGKPMIQWIVERLKACKTPDILILATSDRRQDQPLVEFCLEYDVPVYRGSELDVLDRYYQCAREYRLENIIRATGDNPLVDPEACDRLVDFYFSRDLEYATIITNGPAGFPIGVGVEIFSMGALEKSWIEGHAPHHREHVNEYILENPSLFRQAVMPAPEDKCAPDLSLTVDTETQFENVAGIYSVYLEKHPSRQVPVNWAIQYIKDHQLQHNQRWDTGK